MKQIKKNIKINISFPKKEPRTVVSKPSYTLIKVNRITSFHTQRKSFKKERYLILNSFNNRNAITKARFSSLNFAINSSKYYNLQENIEICENCQRKEIENEIHMIFSRDKYDNIQKKAIKDINEVDNINFQTKNKIEKLKLFFAKGSSGSFLQTVLCESL